MELTRNEVNRFTKGLNLPGLQKSPMGLPPFLQRKEEMGADYLREVPGYILEKPPGYDMKNNVDPRYFSLTERRPGCRYACGA